MGQKRHGEIFLYFQHLISMIRRNFWQSLKKILYKGFRATLNFRKLRVFLASNIVAVVTYCATKMITTCSPMVGQFFDTMIVASSDKEWL